MMPPTIHTCNQRLLIKENGLLQNGWQYIDTHKLVLLATELEYNHWNHDSSFSRAHVQLDYRSPPLPKQLIYSLELFRTNLKMLLHLERQPPRILPWIPYSSAFELLNKFLFLSLYRETFKTVHFVFKYTQKSPDVHMRLHFLSPLMSILPRLDSSHVFLAVDQEKVAK